MRPNGGLIRADDALGFRAARAICRAKSPDLTFFAQLLPAPKRDAVCAVIAVQRMLCEAMEVASKGTIDGARGLREHPIAVSHAGGCCSSSGESANALLEMFAERLDQIEADRLELPSPQSRSQPQHALHGFARAAHRFEIPRRYVADYADSLRTEQRVVRFPTWRSLESYLDQSGGSIARAVACVVGMTHSQVLQCAGGLGKAIRLLSATEHLADDFAAGRILLPLEDFAACMYSEHDLATGVANTALRRLIDRQTSRIAEWLKQARGALTMLAGDRERLATAWLLADCERRLRRIERCEDSRLLSLRPERFTVGGALRRLPEAWAETRRANRLRESPAAAGW